MGNAQGGKKEQGKVKNLNEIINFVATHYILTQSFEDMEMLKDPEYCDKLIVVTSDVLSQYLTTKEVDYLAQKMKQGVEVDQMAKDKLLYFEKESLPHIDVKNKVSKKRMCIGIAKYYVKVAHIFGAIVGTINPTYSYKDEFGTRHMVPFSEKNKIPKGTEVKINKINLCSERVNALVNGEDLSMSDPSQPIKIKPNFCQMNTNKNATETSQELVVKTLGDEPGIDQLERLYMDVYDYQSGVFTGMSDAMKKEYQTDLAVLYKSFTGKDTVPSNITKFAQIPLRDFQSMDGCKAEPNNQYLKEYVGTSKQKLFVQYANHIKETMKHAEDNKNALIGILDNLFVFAVNPQTKKPEITINPALTDAVLNDLVKKTKTSIIALYTTCESDFISGLEIFEQIIQEQIKQQMQTKIDKLKEDMKSPSLETQI
jgi:hypothetical protein